jgi:hypothetical protein
MTAVRLASKVVAARADANVAVAASASSEMSE